MSNFGVVRDKYSEDTARIENSALSVVSQNITSEIIDMYMCQIKGETTVASALSIDSKVVTVVNPTGAVVGECVNIIENGRVMQAIITAISGNDITFNTPAEQAYTTEAKVCFGAWNMNVNASLTPYIYSVKPPP